MHKNQFQSPENKFQNVIRMSAHQKREATEAVYDNPFHDIVEGSVKLQCNKFRGYTASYKFFYFENDHCFCDGDNDQGPFENFVDIWKCLECHDLTWSFQDGDAAIVCTNEHCNAIDTY